MELRAIVEVPELVGIIGESGVNHGIDEDAPGKKARVVGGDGTLAEQALVVVGKGVLMRLVEAGAVVQQAAGDGIDEDDVDRAARGMDRPAGVVGGIEASRIGDEGRARSPRRPASSRSGCSP